MEQPQDRPATRAKNTSQHPGEIIGKKKRRTKAEVEQEKARLRMEKELKQQQKDEGIGRVAQLEDKMAIEDFNVGNAHPRCYDGIRNGPIGNQDADEILDDGIQLPPKKKRTTTHSGTGLSADHRHDMEDSENLTATRVHRKRKQPETERVAPTRRSTRIRGDIDESEVPSCEYQKKVPVPYHITSQKFGPENLGASQSATMPKSAQAVQPSTAPDDELTDIDEPGPIKNKRSLTRSYAMTFEKPGSVMDEDEDQGGSVDDEYKPVTEPEKELPIQLDDDPTPKKKQKVAKIPVREAVNARREEPASCQELSKTPCDESTCVSFLAIMSSLILNETTLFYHDICSTKSTKNMSGLIKNWATEVNRPKKPSKLSNQGRRDTASLAVRTASSTTAISQIRTTNNSNAVVTTKNNAPMKQVNYGRQDDDTISFGPSEEDEAEEREAALSSPIKGNRRLTSTAIVKIENLSPLPKRTLGRKEKFTNADLPPSCQDSNLWRRSFIPTYHQYLACRNDSWTISDADAIDLMQKIWDYTYGARVPYTMKTAGAVFCIADQRACEWRSGFGSTALAVLKAFFEQNKFNSDDAQKEFAKAALEQWTFLYADVYEKKGETKRKGIFGGPLVIQTFAAHFNATRGAMSLSVLGIEETNKPSVALALSAAAAERALTLWRDGFVSCETATESKTGERSTTFIKTVNRMTGKESTKASDFNQANWGAVTSDYLSSIKKNLSGGKKFDNIIQEAMSFAKLRQRGESTATSSTAPEYEVVNERALLADDSDDDDDDD